MSNESMANFITDTPSDVAELLAKNEFLEKENAELNKTIRDLHKSILYSQGVDPSQIQALQKENAELRKIAQDLKEYQDHESADEIPCSIMDILCANKATIDRLLGGEK